MPKYEITITSTFNIDSDDFPDDDLIIDDCRRHPGILLENLLVENIDEI